MSELEKAIEYKPKRHLMQMSKEILTPLTILLYLMLFDNIEFYSWIYIIIALVVILIISGSIYLKVTLNTDNIRQVPKNKRVFHYILLFTTTFVSATILYKTVQILSATLILETIKGIPTIMKDNPLVLLIEIIRYRNADFLLTLNNKLLLGYILFILIFTIQYIFIRGLNPFVFNIIKLKFKKIYDVKISSTIVYKNVKIINRDNLFLYLDDRTNNRMLAVRVGDIQEIALVENIEK